MERTARHEPVQWALVSHLPAASKKNKDAGYESDADADGGMEQGSRTGLLSIPVARGLELGLHTGAARALDPLAPLRVRRKLEGVWVFLDHQGTSVRSGATPWWEASRSHG